jgi:hypothetical protein
MLLKTIIKINIALLIAIFVLPKNSIAQTIDPVTNLVTYKGSISNAENSIADSKDDIAAYLKGIDGIDSLDFTEKEDGVIIDFLGKINVSYSPKALADKMESGIGYALAKNSKPYGYFNYVGSLYLKEDKLLYRFNNYDHYLPKKPRRSLGKIEQELGHKTNPLFWKSYKEQVDATTKGIIAGMESVLSGTEW